MALLFNNGACYFITVDAHAEECFFDKVEVGTKLGNSWIILILILQLLFSEMICRVNI